MDPPAPTGDVALGYSSPSRQGRNRIRSQQACQNCRALKARCVPSENSDRCQKCVRSNTECVPHIPKPHSQRKKRRVRSLANMEAKIQELYQLVGDPNTTRERTLSVDQGSETTNMSSAGTAGADLQTMLCEILDPTDVYSHCRKFQMMDYDDATVLLDQFRSKTDNFPFVVISQETTIEELVKDRPMLALSVLLVSTRFDLELQAEIETLLQKTIARTVAVDGDRSLEIVQALLIYIAWHHYYLRHDKQHTYVYLNMAIAMCIDMGFHKPNPRGWDGISLVSVTNDSSYESLLECRRAYLGCYYLSCGLGTLGFHKPQTVYYNEYLQRIAVEVGERGNATNDKFIPAMTELMHIAELHDNIIRRQARNLFSSSSEQSEIRLAVSHAEKRLNRWDNDYLTMLDECSWLQYTRCFLMIHFYSRGFLSAETLDLEGHDHPCSYFRLSMLLLCFEKIKRLLDSFLESPRRLLDLAMVEFSHLITSLVIMGRLARPLRSMNSQDVQKVDGYIDMLTNRFAMESGNPNNEHHPSNLQAWVMRIASCLKYWVENGGFPTTTMYSNVDLEYNVASAEAVGQAAQVPAQAPYTTETLQDTSLQRTPTNISFGQEQPFAAASSDIGVTEEAMNTGDDFWNGFIWEWPNMAHPHAPSSQPPTY